MLEQFALWAIRLYGSPCSVCGRPATILWVLADGRVVQHGGGQRGTALCGIPNPRPTETPVPESDQVGRRRAA